MAEEENTDPPKEDDPDETAALNAQLKQNQGIARNNVDNLKRIQRLEKVGGTLDYTHTILEALKAFGGEVNLSFLSLVLADHDLLAKARASLVAKKLIEEIPMKNRKILKLVNAA